jgi:hypothetical protein
MEHEEAVDEITDTLRKRSSHTTLSFSPTNEDVDIPDSKKRTVISVESMNSKVITPEMEARLRFYDKVAQEVSIKLALEKSCRKKKYVMEDSNALCSSSSSSTSSSSSSSASASANAPNKKERVNETEPQGKLHKPYSPRLPETTQRQPYAVRVPETKLRQPYAARLPETILRQPYAVRLPETTLRQRQPETTGRKIYDRETKPRKKYARRTHNSGIEVGSTVQVQQLT